MPRHPHLLPADDAWRWAALLDTDDHIHTHTLSLSKSSASNTCMLRRERLQSAKEQKQAAFRQQQEARRQKLALRSLPSSVLAEESDSL
jgi:hypothetical protein